LRPVRVDKNDTGRGKKKDSRELQKNRELNKSRVIKILPEEKMYLKK